MLMDFCLLLDTLSDHGFMAIKRQMAACGRKFVSKRDTPKAHALMSLLCEKDIMFRLSREQFGKLIYSLFPDEILEREWLLRYCDIIQRFLDVIHVAKMNDRCELYYDLVCKRLIPNQQKLVKDNDNLLGCMQNLADIYKYTGCIARCMLDTESHVFSLKVNMRVMNFVAQTVTDEMMKSENFSHAEQMYSIVINWLLIAVLSDQDGFSTARGR